MKKIDIIKKILETDFSTSGEMLFYLKKGLKQEKKKELEKLLKENQ